MRKLPAGIALLTLSAATLVACSAAPDNGCARPVPADRTQSALVSASGDFGVPPEVSLPSPLHVDSTQWTDAITGSGNPLATDDQLVVLDVTFASGATGESFVATPYSGAASTAVPLSRWSETLPGLADALHCATEGSRVVVALAPDGISAEVSSGLGLAATDSAVAVVDVRKVYLGHADGADQYTESHGVPTVVRGEGGRPGVIIPDGQPPQDLIVETLKRGDGDVVAGDDSVRVNYTGLTWADRKVFESTWDSTPVSIVPSKTIPGFTAALEGQTVGSQVLVVIPPEQGYGDTAEGSIPAGSTLVFVVDILGIDG